MSKFNKTQVVYIHGFNSSVNSDTLKMLQQPFPSAIGLTYDHNEPQTSLKDMVIKLEKFHDSDLIIVGSSLGGWYAEQLTKYIVGKYILYNPAINPEVSLSKYGVSQEVLYKYKSLQTTLCASNRTVILCSDDDVIDPKDSLVKYKGYAEIVPSTGGHRMTSDNMDLIVDLIEYYKNQLT